MEAGCPGTQAGSFAEIRIMLILYAKNCLGKRAHKPECAYVIPAWHVTQKEFWKEFLCLLKWTLLQTHKLVARLPACIGMMILYG